MFLTMKMINLLNKLPFGNNTVAILEMFKLKPEVFALAFQRRKSLLDEI